MNDSINYLRSRFIGKEVFLVLIVILTILVFVVLTRDIGSSMNVEI